MFTLLGCMIMECFAPCSFLSSIPCAPCWPNGWFFGSLGALMGGFVGAIATSMIGLAEGLCTTCGGLSAVLGAMAGGSLQICSGLIHFL